MVGDRFLQIGRDKSLDDHAAIRVRLIQNAAIEKCFRSIPGHERSDLITGEQFHFTRTIAHRDTHSVVVRIGCDDKIGIGFLCQLNAETKCLGIFRIRRLHRRKISIEAILFRRRLGN